MLKKLRGISYAPSVYAAVYSAQTSGESFFVFNKSATVGYTASCAQDTGCFHRPAETEGSYCDGVAVGAKALRRFLAIPVKRVFFINYTAANPQYSQSQFQNEEWNDHQQQ